MFKFILKHIVFLSLVNTVLAYGGNNQNQIASSALDRLRIYFENNQYRQLTDIMSLQEQMKSKSPDEVKLKSIREFYIKIKDNDRFKPEVKNYVLKEIKSSYQALKLNRLQPSTKIPKPNFKPINLRPIHIKAEPIDRINPSTQGIWKRNFIIVGSMIFTFFSLLVGLLLRKNYSLQQKQTGEYHQKDIQHVNSGDTKILDQSLLSTVLKLSTSILPQNSYVVFDFQGKVTKFSANMKNLVANQIEVGMLWKDILERHFHQIGEGASRYYISLHNTEKFFAASTKSIPNLSLNICQLIEVDKQMVIQTETYRDHYYLEHPCSLVDLFENALVDTSSFRDFNLVDNVLVESSGIDVSFQSEKDIENLFLSLAQLIKYVYEDEAPFAKVHFDTFKERHIINLEFMNYQFGPLNEATSKNFMVLIEDIKAQLLNVAGSIVVKNKSGTQDSAIVQVIFDQIISRDISIEDEFELQVL